MSFEQYRSAFDRDGFVVVRRFLAPAELGDLLRCLDRFVREVLPTLPDGRRFAGVRPGSETPEQMRYLTTDPFFRDYARHPTWKALAEALLGEEAGARAPEWFNKPPRASQPTPPHQDNYYFHLEPANVVTLWLALDPVDQGNGCLRFVAGSHRRGIRPHGRTDIPVFTQGVSDYGPADRAREVAVVLEPGDVVAHHGETIHRADANRSTRNRRALGMVFTGVRCRKAGAGRPSAP